MELGQLTEALQAYRTALEIDPGNTIARRNIARLEEATGEQAAPTAGSPGAVRSHVFIEEVGKTYVTDLRRPAAREVLNALDPADPVELRPEGSTVQVYTTDGQRVGQLEPRIAQRLLQLLEMGNRYQAYVVALTEDSLRVILRETYRNPDAPIQISFPRQAKIAAPRPYLRTTGRAAHELEPDLLLDTDDEEEEIEEEELEEEEILEEEVEDDEFLDTAEGLDEDSPLGG